jgi:hypothetical protein
MLASRDEERGELSLHSGAVWVALGVADSGAICSKFQRTVRVVPETRRDSRQGFSDVLPRFRRN